jgi:hypothetical protein
MSMIPLAVFYARYRYIAYRIYLRFKMGKCFRDEYLRDKKLGVLDFLPQIPYNADGLKVVLGVGKALMIITCFFLVDNKRENSMLEHT